MDLNFLKILYTSNNIKSGHERFGSFVVSRQPTISKVSPYWKIGATSDPMQGKDVVQKLFVR